MNKVIHLDDILISDEAFEEILRDEDIELRQEQREENRNLRREREDREDFERDSGARP